MSLFRSRFVTACQQLLALGAVLAVLTPAASLISLDVVRQPPAGATVSGAGAGAGALSAYGRVARRSATLPVGVVEAEVREVALTGDEGTAARRVVGGVTHVTSRPEVVTGYGAVGVTWAPQEQVSESELTVSARTLSAGTWSRWTEVEYDAEHGPDPGSREGRRARPGTEPLLIGEVDRVQVRVTDNSGRTPADLRLAVIDPGTPTRTVSQRAALDTAETTAAETTAAEPAARGGGTPEPQIFSRAQWGADESMRDKRSLRYYEVHAGFVHHTVNANDYSRDEVPGILRSIYAYHTKSRGWSDVGYNFLVDRFGRIWEGRAGGVDRPVVGAHTLGYNDYAFAMSAIGNFEQVKPSQAMVEAYGALFAWKLSLHGVDASSTEQQVGSDTFPAINGHRDDYTKRHVNASRHHPGGVISTLSLGEGAFEGSADDYRLPDASPFATAFKYSRFDARGVVPPRDATAMRAGRVGPKRAAPVWDPAGGVDKLVPHLNFVGSDLNRGRPGRRPKAKTAEACYSACAKTRGCAAFTFITSPGFNEKARHGHDRCWLKKAGFERGAEYSSGTISGVVGREG